MASRVASFLSELKRRKVGRVAFAYAVAGIGVIEGAQLLLDAFGIARIAWQLKESPASAPGIGSAPENVSAETRKEAGDLAIGRGLYSAFPHTPRAAPPIPRL